MGDLHGTPPGEVENLCQIMLLKQRLMRLSVINFDYGARTKAMPPRVVMRFDQERLALKPEHVTQFVKKSPNYRRVLQDSRIMVYLQPFSDEREIIEQSKELADELILICFKDKKVN